MELFTATRKLKKFYLTTRDIRCVTRGAHIELSSCQKKVSFPVAVSNFIKVGPLVFLL